MLSDTLSAKEREAQAPGACVPLAPPPRLPPYLPSEHRHHIFPQARREAAADMRARRENAAHREMVAAAGGVATGEQVRQLSVLVNVRLSQLVEQPSEALWWKLFHHADDDGSGKISFGELETMARTDLSLTPQVLPRRMLQRVWVALDRDGAGWISAGAFGGFMRRGGQAVREQGPSWKERARQAKAAEADAVKAQWKRLTHRDILASMAGEPPATAEEVADLSARLNAKLLELYEDPDRRQWFNLFRHMDDDGSGQISYVELAGMVREELHLPPSELPDMRLAQLWKALDTDASGYLGAGEFGRFMRRGEPEKEVSWKERLHYKNIASRKAVREDYDR